MVASNPEGDIITSNASAEIRRICSELDLKLVYPQRAHRGDEIKLAVRVENKGTEKLTDILVRCGEGEIGRIGLLPSGSSQTLEKKIIVDQSMRDLISAEAKSPVGKAVDGVIIRKGVEQTVKVTLGRLEDGEKLAEGEGKQPDEGAPVATAAVLGMTVAALDDEARAKYGISADVSGVVVTEVAEGSAAAERGIVAGNGSRQS